MNWSLEKGEKSKMMIIKTTVAILTIAIKISSKYSSKSKKATVATNLSNLDN